MTSADGADSSLDWLQGFEARVIEDWGHLGTMVTPSGARCVGHVPQVAPAAWMFRFYPGCSEAELDAWQERMHSPIPPPWRGLLSSLNGLTMFVRQVHLYGVLSPHGSISRRAADPSPISLDYALLERPQGVAMHPSDFVVGGENGREYDRGSTYILRDTVIFRVTDDGQSELASWPSLASMLEAEYLFFSDLHDRHRTSRALWDAR